MKISYDACWQTMTGMMRAHADILLVVAGAFLFLPMLAQAIYLPPPAPTSADIAALEGLLDFYRANFLPFFLVRLITLAGTACLLALLLAPDRPTVADSIRRATLLLPSLLLADILVQLLVGLGMIALLLPGLYLLGRTALTMPAMVAERITNPLRAIQRSFQLTDRAGWSILGLILVIMIVAWIATFAAVTVVGVVLQLLLPTGAARLSVEVLQALQPAVLTMIYALLGAAIYRQVMAFKGGN
ncbi:MAG: hypothetical protein ACKOXK_04490 [Chakrabartia sp.]